MSASLLHADPGTKEALRRIHEFRNAFGGNELSDLETDVQKYLTFLRHKESKRIRFTGTSEHKHHLKTLLRYLLNICDRERLCTSTVFLAVYLLNSFLDGHKVDKLQIHLVVISCIILAGKVEEREYETPKMKRLKHYLPPKSEFSFSLFRRVEKYILNSFKWDIIVPTASTFLDCFLLYAADGGSLKEPNNNGLDKLGTSKYMVKTDAEYKKIQEAAKKVLQFSLKEIPQEFYPPSCVAATCLMYGRRHAGYNFWTTRLEIVTGHSFQRIQQCLALYIQPLVDSTFNGKYPQWNLPMPVCLDLQPIYSMEFTTESSSTENATTSSMVPEKSFETNIHDTEDNNVEA